MKSLLRKPSCCHPEPFAVAFFSCHPEQSEGSRRSAQGELREGSRFVYNEILRVAQNDIFAVRAFGQQAQ